MMSEKTIIQIQSIQEKIWNQLSDADNEALEMAFHALEKQIVKQPNKDINGWLVCPVCGRMVEWMYYCSHCGQKVCEVEE